MNNLVKTVAIWLVIALVLTTEGFPIAYEVLAGNTTDKSTLKGFLEKIEKQYGKGAVMRLDTEAKDAAAEFEKAQLANEKSGGSVTRVELDRLELNERKAELQIEQAELERRMTALAADSKAVEVEAAENAIERRTIAAPIDGTVVQVFPHEGEWMQPGDPLARVMVAGASLGAYNAVNALAKHPDRVWAAIAMSGTYDFDRFVAGDRSDDYYYNQPLLFLPNLADPGALAWLHQSFFLLATGQGRWEAPWETSRLAEILAQKGIPHQVEYWGQDIDHDWPTWRTMLPLFLDRLA